MRGPSTWTTMSMDVPANESTSISSKDEIGRGSYGALRSATDGPIWPPRHLWPATGPPGKHDPTLPFSLRFMGLSEVAEWLAGYNITSSYL